MNNLLKLIFNEQVKIFVRKSTWAMFIILAILVIGAGFIIKFSDDHRTDHYDQDTWQAEIEAENEAYLKEREEYEKKMEEDEDGYHIPPSMGRYEENLYYLEHDIKPVKFGAWHFTHETKVLLSFLSLFTIIIAAGIVSSEYRWGTIKLLLIRPISRSKILLSKYLSILVFSIVTAIFLFVISFLTGAVLFGFEGELNPYGFTMDSFNSVTGEGNAGGSVFIPLVNDVLAGYGYQMIILVMMATFALLISTVFQSSSLAIGLSIFFMFAGNSIILFLIDYPWAKYILFANTDLSQYVHNDLLIEGMTRQFSIGVLIVYYVIFMVISWLVFTKRDVAGQ